jgi:hypothetical protein
MLQQMKSEQKEEVKQMPNQEGIQTFKTEVPVRKLSEIIP